MLRSRLAIIDRHDMPPEVEAVVDMLTNRRNVEPILEALLPAIWPRLVPAISRMIDRRLGPRRAA